MTNKRLLLYPGAHKTASSLLQAALEVNRPALEASGLSILRRQVFYKSGMKDLLKKKQADAAIDAADWEKMSNDVLGPDWRDKDIVFSMENLFGEFVPLPYRKMGQCLGNLAKLFPDHTIEAVYYVRRQDTFLESLYTQRIHRGYDEDPETFLSAFDETVIDWLSLIQPMIKRLGRKSVKIRAFETIKEGPQRYVARFLKDFNDLPRAQLLEGFTDLGHTNLSLSEVGLRVARATFAELPELRDRRRLTKVLQGEFGNDKFPRFRLSDGLRQGIIDRHRAANVKLVKRGVIPDSLKSHYLFEDAPAPG